MAKMAITTPDGEQQIVREDTGKAYRGVTWALISIFAIAVIALIMFFGSALLSATDDSPTQTPAQIEQQRQ